MDNHTPEQCRKNMQAIRGKDTFMELILRRELWSRGIHYRKNCRDVPGHLDIAFKTKKVAVFCDSEFWHGYGWEKQKEHIQSNRECWIPKIERNIERDADVNEILKSMGWTVIRFLGKDIRKDTEKCADVICDSLRIFHQ